MISRMPVSTANQYREASARSISRCWLPCNAASRQSCRPNGKARRDTPAPPQLDPTQHLEALGDVEKIGGFDHARPDSDEPKAFRRELRDQAVKPWMMIVIDGEKGDQRTGINQNASHLTWPSLWWKRFPRHRDRPSGYCCAPVATGLPGS